MQSMQNIDIVMKYTDPDMLWVQYYIRYDLIKTMVGSLYPSIVESECRRICDRAFEICDDRSVNQSSQERARKIVDSQSKEIPMNDSTPNPNPQNGFFPLIIEMSDNPGEFLLINFTEIPIGQSFQVLACNGTPVILEMIKKMYDYGYHRGVTNCIHEYNRD